MADLDELRELRARLLFQETLDLDDYNDRETLIELIDNELAEHTINRSVGETIIEP